MTTRANMRLSRRTSCLRSSLSWRDTHRSSRRKENRWAILSRSWSKQLKQTYPLFFFLLLFLISCANVLHILVRWIWSFRQADMRFLLCVPLCTIFGQMRSSLTKYRYTQRLARSTERDTWSPYYGWKAQFLYHHKPTKAQSVLSHFPPSEDSHRR